MDKIFLDLFFLDINMSAKELGQIHQVDWAFQLAPTASGLVFTKDFAFALSEQLQTMVRQGNYFKLVGVDIALDPDPAASNSAGRITGEILYYAPTRQRCAAYRHAFKAMADQMSNQGIPMRSNENYDFRVGLTDFNLPPLENQATLDGTTALALNNTASAGASVFAVWNESQQPSQTGTVTFGEGFDTLLASGGAKTDFVLNNQTAIREADFASTDFQRIPFQVAYGGDDTTATFQWRPDPALYVAVMCGLFTVRVNEIQMEPGTVSLNLHTTFSIAGWKSIMGDPEKKKKRLSRRKGSTRNK